MLSAVLAHLSDSSPNISYPRRFKLGIEVLRACQLVINQSCWKDMYFLLRSCNDTRAEPKHIPICDWNKSMVSAVVFFVLCWPILVSLFLRFLHHMLQFWHFAFHATTQKCLRHVAYRFITTMSISSFCLENAHMFTTIMLLVSLLTSLYSAQCTQDSWVVHLGEHKLVKKYDGAYGVWQSCCFHSYSSTY